MASHSTYSRLPRESFHAYAQYRKAERLVVALLEAHIPAEAVPDLSNHRKRQLETAAAVRIASDITWGIAALILSQHPTTRQRQHITVADVHNAIRETVVSARQTSLF